MLIILTCMQNKGEIDMYRNAIVDELGHVMFWCDELQGEDQIECILDSHPEWNRRYVEID